VKFDKKRFLVNLRHDFPAGIVVFLVALPLCLGIALASEAPLFSGVIAGVVGGIVVSILSGSEVSVSGPAAGLTVIVAAGIHKMGGFEAFLCAVVLAGVFQIGLSMLRAGFLATLFPNSVIKGMLAAIGLTIILKQFPYALGGFGEFESDMAFWDILGSKATLPFLIKAVEGINTSALLICLVSLLILLVWEKPLVKENPYLKKVPGALVAVAVAAIINEIFKAGLPSLALRAEDGHLVSLPEINSWKSLVAELRFPDFSAITRGTTWGLAATLAAVGSIETLLCLESTDKLDPYRRVSNANRELFAQGSGNLISGLLGGIPMTSVVVRSSANIYAGGKTRLSAFIHGVVLLLSVVSIAGILNLIPLAALAAVLLLVGYKLASPKLFKQMYKEGWDQLIPFAVTIVAIFFTDLLKGVIIGLGVGIFFVVRASFYSAILVVREGKDVFFRFTKDLTFIHKIKLRQELDKLEDGCHIYIDGSRAMYIDPDAFEMIQDFMDKAGKRGISVQLKDVSIRKQIIKTPKLEKKRNGILQKIAARKSRVGT